MNRMNRKQGIVTTLLAGLAAVILIQATLPALAQDWIDVPLSEQTFWDQGGEWRTDVFEIPVAAGTALEHMISMQEENMVVYSWTAEMDDPALLTAEFHGHTERTGDEPGTVMFYRIHQDGKESGTLRAPFSGVHGWYLNNESDQDIVVNLRIAGFYTEVP